MKPQTKKRKVTDSPASRRWPTDDTSNVLALAGSGDTPPPPKATDRNAELLDQLKRTQNSNNEKLDQLAQALVPVPVQVTPAPKRKKTDKERRKPASQKKRAENNTSISITRAEVIAHTERKQQLETFLKEKPLSMREYFNLCERMAVQMWNFSYCNPKYADKQNHFKKWLLTDNLQKVREDPLNSPAFMFENSEKVWRKARKYMGG